MLGRIAELAVETAHLAEQELVVGLAVLVRALRDVSGGSRAAAPLGDDDSQRDGKRARVPE
jgi:hypothetical protein